MTSPGRDGRRWETTLSRHRAGQRDQILTAAMTLLRQRGIAGLTMAAIAEEAGISRPSLYHYFADIDAVLAAWVGREVEHSVAELVERATTMTDPRARLDYLVRAQCETFASQEHRLGAEHFQAETVAPTIRAEVASKMAPLRRLLARTLTQLGVTVDAELAADVLLGAVGALRQHLINGTVTAPDASAAAVGLLRTGWLPSDPSH